MPDPSAPTPRPEPDDPTPLLADRTTDETDVGWGDAEPFADDDVRRLLEDLPPHHVDRD
jgi:hypothetical protein